MTYTSHATANSARPKKAPDHFISSQVLDVGGGNTLANFFSSMSMDGMSPQSYAAHGTHATEA